MCKHHTPRTKLTPLKRWLEDQDARETRDAERAFQEAVDAKVRKP